MSSQTSASLSSPAFRITRVENFKKWFDLWSDVQVTIYALGKDHIVAGCALGEVTCKDELGAIRVLYDKKIGEFGCHWKIEEMPIEFKYAKVTFGDLFDFYTSADGVLRIPKWFSMRYALDEFLEQEDARVKYHPSRVQQFIDANGLDQLGLME